jgi:hypothetical protein
MSIEIDHTHVAEAEATAADPDPSPPELPPASPTPWHLREPLAAAALVAATPLAAQLLKGERRLLSAVGIGVVGGAFVWARGEVTPTRDPKLEPGVPLRVPG